MPAKSIAQQHLMQAAEHGADFPMAKKLRKSMTHSQLHDFSVGSEADKPEHVAQPSVLGGADPGIVSANTNTFKQGGLSEFDATRKALQVSRKGHPNRHKNLGKFLHKKGSKAPID